MNARTPATRRHSRFGTARRRLPRPLNALALAAALLATACATRGLPPTDQMGVARAAVDAANTAGAQRYAPGELRLANDKLALADKAMLGKDHDAALRHAQQAQADAQLAIAKMLATNARIAADRATSAARSPSASPPADAVRTDPGPTR